MAECFQIPVTYQTSAARGSPYYYAADFPPSGIAEQTPFTVGDNKTYNGFWNPPLDPRKGYHIHFQAVSSVEKVSGELCDENFESCLIVHWNFSVNSVPACILAHNDEQQFECQ